MKLVLDASVILKFVLTQDELYKEKALEVVKNFQANLVEIILPAFWKYEVGNTLINKNLEYFKEFYDFLLNLSLPEYEFSNTELIDIGKFAKKNKVTFYDGSYHYLALLTSSTLVTSDEKYFEKVKSSGNIVLLKNLKLD